MQKIRTFGAALLATACTLSGAQSAGCVNGSNITPLKVAAMQQELMVAALTCHEIARYNHFVRSRRPELIDSDNRLKVYFAQHRGGEAAYHLFKTELANDSSLRSIHAPESFCAHAASEFDSADSSMSLAVLVGTQSSTLGKAYRACRERDDYASLTGDAVPPSPTRDPRFAGDAAPSSPSYARVDSDTEDDGAGLAAQKQSSGPSRRDRYAPTNPERDADWRHRDLGRIDDQDDDDSDDR